VSEENQTQETKQPVTPETIEQSFSEIQEDVKEEIKLSNATFTDDIFLPSYKSNNYRVTLPSVSLTEFSKKIAEFQKLNLNEDGSNASLNEWKKATEEAVESYTPGSMYQDRFHDEKSDFKQGIETNEGKLNTISSLKFKKQEGELKGEVALLKVSKLLGLGDVISIPLPHSGIWVTIKPPTEKDLIDFYNSVFREKIIFGRATQGLTLTNFSVHINNRLFEFILKHVHSLNYGEIPKEELRNYVLIHDFHILAWGFACTMYPNGYDFQRACVNDIEQCSHIDKAVINLTKLLWVDNASLTDLQKNIMSEYRPNKHSIETYRKFISEHSKVVGSDFTTANGIKFKLKIPTFAEYTFDGLNWINKINDAIEGVILEDSDKEAEAKIELLNQYVKSSVLRQFNHFIDYIEFDDNVVSDRETINSLLEALSADDDLRNEISKAILKFKAETTIALIGIPDYKCPNCGFNQNKNAINEKLTNVIPLDVMNLAFLVLTSKISKILAREV